MRIDDRSRSKVRETHQLSPRSNSILKKTIQNNLRGKKDYPNFYRKFKCA